MQDMRRGVVAFVSMLAVVGTATAGPASREAIVDALVRDGQLSKACVREDPPKEVLIDMRLVDLNSDGVSEYFVEGMRSCACGAQRCYYWVYAQEGRALRLIMVAQGDRVDIGAERTNGYKDLIVTYSYRGKVSKTTLHFKGASYTETRECGTSQNVNQALSGIVFCVWRKGSRTSLRYGAGGASRGDRSRRAA
jgi:hypothetical protein